MKIRSTCTFEVCFSVNSFVALTSLHDLVATQDLASLVTV